MGVKIGDRLGRYEILAPLGAGGMGEVYRARDSVLDREVAVKVLLPEVADEPDRLERFAREAKAVAALNHPNILDIYDFGTEEGHPFAVMELLEGRSLHDRIWRDGEPLSWKRAAEIGSAVAAGLTAAHAKGVVHRDLKPGNIFLCADGRIKILDFGLARLVSPAEAPIDSMEETLTQMGLVHLEDAGEEQTDTAGEPLTRKGTVLGTAGYMAPEQVRGQRADHRSDIFALGCVLYEMVAAKNPFKRDTGVQTLSAILEDEPEELSSSGIEVPPAYESAVEKCLQKDPQDRYDSISQVSEALAICIAGPRAVRERPGLIPGRKGLAVLAAIVVAAAVALWWWVGGSGARWARSEALPEITRLSEAGEIYEAYDLALEATRYIPYDPELNKKLDRITLPLPIVTEPPGATVHIKGYMTPDAPWQLLGETPFQARIPYALTRFKISKEGFEDFIGAPFGEQPLMLLSSGFPLDPVGTRPAGMVRIPGGGIQRPEFELVAIDSYWLDRYEVTNSQFKSFVDAGGYEFEEYWTAPFIDGDRELSRAEAMERFRDATGRPGPATWELGTYPYGQGDYPVGGVSWHEAAAYCASVGKSLPTVYHWHGATAQDQISDILRLSNFNGEGPAPVGSFAGLGDYGTLDMAGNVKEWCWNERGERRFILGGSWDEPTYMFKDPDARVPLDRLPTYGIRCALYPSPPPEASLQTITLKSLYDNPEPVSDEVFGAYLRLYAYDRTPLEAKIESVDDASPHWRKETVSFDAAYGDERVIALLFLPRNVPPPWQAVVVFPGSDVFLSSSSENLASEYLFDFIPRSGRILVYPIYQGMYERFDLDKLAWNRFRDLMVMWSKDLGRTIDYLEEREDIDHTRVAYYGFSLGSVNGPVFTAIDQRFEAAVLLAGGQQGDAPPEINVINFAPRSVVPTLMINGRDDFILPLETSQKPFLEMLGAPAEHKRLAVLDGGHLPRDRQAIIRETLDWLDRYLGPVAD